MDYGFILIVAAYFGALQLATRTNAGVLVCSLAAVVLPYVIGTVVRSILMGSFDLPLVGIIVVMLQFIAACIIFKKIENEESLLTTISWSVSGFIVIIFLIPFVIQKII